MAEILQVHQKSEKSVPHSAVHPPVSHTAVRALGANPTGWYFRSNLSDTYANGSGRSNSMSSSPDIIPFGSIPISTSKYQQTFLDTFNNDLGANLVVNDLNYIYLRGKALTDVASVTFKLYYIPANILLYPSFWKNNVITTADGKDQVTVSNVKANTPIVVDPPFLWVKTPSPTPSDHYCLIARTTDSPDPSTIKHGSIGEFAQWLAENDGYGWRNTTTVTGGIPDQLQKYTSINIPAEWEAASAWVAMNADNIPVGWDVSFTLTVPDANGNSISLAKTPTTQNKFVYGTPAVFNPGYTSDVYYSIWTNGIAELPDKEFHISIDIAIFTDDSTPTLFSKSVHISEVSHSLEYTKGHLKLAPHLNAKDVHGIKRAYKVGGDRIQRAKIGTKLLV